MVHAAAVAPADDFDEPLVAERQGERWVEQNRSRVRKLVPHELPERLAARRGRLARPLVGARPNRAPVVDAVAADVSAGGERCPSRFWQCSALRLERRARTLGQDAAEEGQLPLLSP